MLGTILYGPRDVRYEERQDPKIFKPTDAIIRSSVTCVCGSDLWPYRGIQPIADLGDGTRTLRSRRRGRQRGQDCEEGPIRYRIVLHIRQQLS